MRTFIKTCRSFSFFIVLPDYFQKAINALFPVFHELRKLKVRIRCMMNFNVDKAWVGIWGSSLRGKKGRSDGKDLLRDRIEYSLAEWNNKISSYSMNTLDNKVTGYRLGIRPEVRGGGCNLYASATNLINIKHKHTDQPNKKNVRIPTASTCCLCWTIVAGNNSFSKMFRAML